MNTYSTKGEILDNFKIILLAETFSKFQKLPYLAPKNASKPKFFSEN